MASQVILKKSSVAARVPVAGDLAYGELALNYADGLLYFKKSDGSISSFSGTSSSTGTVTSVAALTLGTTGTDVSSSVVNSSSTPTITLNIPTASASNRGVLSAADWSTFNGKQAALGFTPYNATNPSGYTSNTGTVTSVTATGPVSSTGGTTPVISMTAATTSVDGYLTAADWTTFNSKQTALGFTAESTANKGAASGYVPLDATSKIASTYLPSYVDDVLEYANLAALPATGETGKIYITVDDNKTYRWSGTVYIVITASPGSTDSVTEGSSNLYFTTARARAAITAGTGITVTDGVVASTITQYTDTLATTAAKAATKPLRYSIK